MDLPENFCILPFIHLSSKPPGQARYCCFSPNHIILDDEGNELKLDSNLDAFWNSKHARNFRQQFLNNERPVECQYCWNEEAVGKKSKRVKELRNYKDKYMNRIEYAVEHDGYVEPPVYLDLRLGNKCNLKCRTCNSMFSSLLESEVKQWDDLYFAKAEQFKAKVDINEWYQTEQFLKNMETIIPHLEHVYITGGEPSIIPELTTFMKKCIEADKQDEILIRFNTNLAVYVKEFYDTLKQFKMVDLGPSVDAIGNKLTYLRYPLKWDTFKKNFIKVLDMPSHIGISVNCTVSIYNIFHLEELYFSIHDIAGDRRINFIFEVAHEPDYINFNILTDELKLRADARIMKFIATNELTQQQVEDLISIRSMLYVPVDNIDIKQQRFREHVLYLDHIRNENFIETFPELKEMLDDK